MVKLNVATGEFWDAAVPKSAESPSIGRENSNEIARDIARHSRDTERVLTVESARLSAIMIR
jgi:hypothetical protein